MSPSGTRPRAATIGQAGQHVPGSPGRSSAPARKHPEKAAAGSRTLSRALFSACSGAGGAGALGRRVHGLRAELSVPGAGAQVRLWDIRTSGCVRVFDQHSTSEASSRCAPPPPCARPALHAARQRPRPADSTAVRVTWMRAGSGGARSGSQCHEAQARALHTGNASESRAAACACSALTQHHSRAAAEPSQCPQRLRTPGRCSAGRRAGHSRSVTRMSERTAAGSLRRPAPAQGWSAAPRRPDGRAARQAAAPARGLAGAAARRAHHRARRLGHRGAADAGRPALAHRRQRLARAPVGRQAQPARSPALPPAGRPRSRGALGSIWRRGGGAQLPRRGVRLAALPCRAGGTRGHNDVGGASWRAPLLLSRARVRVGWMPRRRCAAEAAARARRNLLVNYADTFNRARKVGGPAQGPSQGSLGV